MRTPICEFVRDFAEQDGLRLHMPGHKGQGPLGVETLDITEVPGADSLYEASGIIRESEENAARLFGCPTFYSAEGSSLCIRAMLHLAAISARMAGKTPKIAAGRNAHKTFLSGAALLGLDVLWLTPECPDSYLSCRIEPEQLDAVLAREQVTAVYLTSPDYLGNTADIAALSAVCRRHGVLLLVDNAHGAYLRFLPRSRHPMDLGADLCCDSAHKTLPVLTGGAYLHLSLNLPSFFAEQAKNALALFGSTSPSYLILQSLDAANRYLAGDYRTRLADFCEETARLKARLSAHGFCLQGDEPLKITVKTKPFGWYGIELAEFLLERNVVPEFSDPDFLVLMLTPENGDLSRLEEALCSAERRPAIGEMPPVFALPERALTIRDAVLSPCETIPAEKSCGRILAAASVGCPPAVPIVVCGERIDEAALRCFRYYGIDACTVVRVPANS